MFWDKTASVWCALCDEIPLALESGSFDALVEKVKITAPEILEMNGKASACMLNFVSDRKDEVA
jgi:hypothetical protein